MRSPVLLVCLTLAAAAPATADNLVVNGDFHTTVASWSLTDPADSVVWSELDAAQSETSGSALLIRSGGQQFTESSLSQCIPVQPEFAYSFGLSVRVPDSNASTGRVGFQLTWSSQADCSGTALDTTLVDAEGASGEWQALERVGVVAPAGAVSVRLELWAYSRFPDEFRVHFDRVRMQEGGCFADATTLCLNDGSFRVEASWSTEQGASGQGQAIQLTSDTGYFWFFNSANVELLVKVLNACGVNNHSWVFAGGLTNVEVVLTVTDTRTGESRSYTNPLGAPFEPIQDTSAFSTCP